MLAHTRLAIVDPSDAGAQPMISGDGRFHLVCNGEIYNFPELRRELERSGRRFVSRCDTEVVLHGFDAWDVNLFERLNGQFALAIYDSVENRIVVARDRAGEKPLLLAPLPEGRGWVFGSEAKALFCWPEVSRKPNFSTLHDFLSYQYAVGDRTAFEDVFRLPAASYATLSAQGIETVRYWEPSSPDPDNGLAKDMDAVSEELTRLIDQAVDRQSMSDFPVGVFLSGGIDSASVARSISSRGLFPQTYSVGFSHFPEDEGDRAARTARFLKTDHHRLDGMGEIGPALLARALWHFNEPIADPAILPYFVLSEFASKHVKVVMGGEGADELLGGYSRYLACSAANRLFERCPKSFRRLLAHTADSTRKAQRGPLPLRYLFRLMQEADRPSAQRYFDWISVFGAVQKAELYYPESPLAKFEDSERIVEAFISGDRFDVEQAMEFDFAYYLPGSLLPKADLMGMAHSLEVRSPFLDLDLIDFCDRLPVSIRLLDFLPKAPLRFALEGKLPESVLATSKTGFSVPIAAALNGPLRSLLDRLLSPESIERRGLFDPDSVRDMVEGDLVQNRYRIWMLLILEAWMRIWCDPVTPPDSPEEAVALLAG